MRWLLAGSVGLDSLAEAWRLSATINDLQSVRLGAYDPAETDGYLNRYTLRAGFSLTPAARAVLLQHAGWPIPFFLGHFIVALDGARDGLTTIEPPLVDAAFQELTSVAHRTIYSPWNERLDDQLTPPQAQLARQILERVARDPAGADESTLDAAGVLSRTMLNLLYADGYVAQQEDGKWTFRSPLLRTYWLRFVCGRN